MAKANMPRISREVRAILDRELSSHALAHVRHNLMAQGGSDRSEHAVSKYRVLENVPTYTLAVAQAARSGLKDPERSGTVLLIQWPNNLLGKVEIHENHGHPTLTRVSTGTLASDLENLLVRLRGGLMRAARKSAPEIRILGVPAIHLLCLWKHWSKGAGKDSFTPVMLNFIGLHKGRVYSQSHVNAVVQRSAVDLIVKWYDRQQDISKPVPVR